MEVNECNLDNALYKGTKEVPLDGLLEEASKLLSLCNKANKCFDLTRESSKRKSFVLDIYSKLYAVYAQFEILLKHYHRDEIWKNIGELNEILRTSSFIRRCQDRPLGYTGDYIAIEQVLNIDKFSDPNSLGYEIDKHILESPLCQQHRNKIRYEVDLIKRTVIEQENANILSFSVGGCSVISKILPYLQGKKFKFHFHDTHDAAIKAAKKRLSPILNQVEFFSGNLIRLIRKELPETRFELITMGGIMDYISDRAFVVIIKPLYEKLKKGGCLMLTQLSKYSSFESVMHYVLFWDVFHRTEGDLMKIFASCGIPEDKVNISTDLTGITYLVELTK